MSMNADDSPDNSDAAVIPFARQGISASREALAARTDRSPRRKTLSIVMPVRNEEGNLLRAYDEVSAAMAHLPYDYEVLVIDNASGDRSGSLAAELCARDDRW